MSASLSQADAAFMKALGRRIRLLRWTRDLTQDQLADAAGISRSFVSLIEHGTHGVDVVRLLHVAEALGMRLLELLDVDAPAVIEPAGRIATDT